MYSFKIKVNKNVVSLVSLILLTILIIPILGTVIPFVLLLYSIDLFLIFTKKDKWAIYFFIMCCIMQNLVCIIFSGYLSSFETADCLCKGTVGIWLCFCEGIQEYMRL